MNTIRERAAAAGLASPLHVLVVDDEPSARSGMARAVSALGHVVRVASDGREALALHEREFADVILTDWRMPNMSGDELCRRVRALDGDDRYTYLVMVTAYDDDEHRLAGMQAGADDLLVKPIDLAQLEARLVSAARVIDLDRRRSEKAAMLRRDSVRLLAAAHTDPLTSLANRRCLDEDLARAMTNAVRHGTRPTALILDLDHFKDYNDRFGHLAGDEVLRKVSAALQREMRSGDRAYRYGGEEFLVLLPDGSDGMAAAERLRAAIVALSIVFDASTVVTVSIGVAQLDPSRDASAEEWLRRADAALYCAKANGRNRVVVD
jgi:two-component system chemotaxis response regulator CheY